MISFENDYNTGAHPKVLERLLETNTVPQTGYGMDEYSAQAKEKIKAACNCPEAEVEFLVGGTQTNSLIIDAMLEEYEGVLAATTGHISAHEAGAVECTGHKILEIPGHAGKIDANELRAWIERFYGDDNHEHMVFPGMVYISQPTEYGTLYTKEELTVLHGICQQYDMPLYIDGARLSYALNSREADMTLADLSKLCDVFYIGGTKVGALLGEAVVFTHNNKPKHFLTIIKRHGALLAKGRVLGLQFDALFTDNLYLEIGKHVIDMAEKLKAIFREKGCEIFLESPTNQQFIVMENSRMEELKKEVAFSFWEVKDETHTVVRFVTGWATTDEDLERLKELL